MKYFKKIAFLALTTGTCILANEPLSIDDALGEVTEIATKTKVNADFVPGTVTIIKGKDLKALGITNLADTNAFDMIVGFDSSVKSLRGAGSIYGSGGNKIKWMINDKIIDTEIWGSGVRGIGPVSFPIPVDAVDRVEIIRGPGSSLYGGNAIYGVVNIITKKNQDGVFTTLARNDSDKYGMSVGGFTNYQKDDLKLNLYASTYADDGWNLKVGSSGIFYNSVVAAYTPGNGPGNLPSSSEGSTIMADISYKDWNFWLYRMHSKSDYAFIGWNPAWSLPSESDPLDQGDTHWLLGAKKDFFIGSVKLVPKIGYNRYKNSAKNLYSWPASYLVNNPSAIDGVFNRDYEQQKIYAEVDVFKQIGVHKLTGGFSYSQTRVLEDATSKNYTYASPFTIAAPLAYSSTAITSTTLDGTKPIRTQKALYIQDEVALSSKVTLTIGARYDAFSDNDSALSPRAALVYRYDEANILKAQYSRAFRAPSFAEQYSSVLNNQKIKPETVDTIDFSIIHKRPEHTAKATVFASLIDNMITFHDYTYETMNLEKRSTIYGLETEFTKHFEKHDLGVNVALFDTRRDDVVANYGTTTPEYFNYNTSKFGLAANVLANVFVTLNKDGQYPTTIWYHYTGSKNRVNNALLDGAGATRNNWASPSVYYSTNGATPAQDYINVTQKIKGVYKNLELDLGIKNLLGKTLKTLYMPLSTPNNQDVPYMKQTIWFSALYKF